MRLGILPKHLNLEHPIWVHAVSVGEVMAARYLIEDLRASYPDKRLVISTVTTTGNKIARGIAREGDFVSYLPLDLSFIIRSVVDRIQPSAFVIVETEIWPNLISYLYTKNIPVLVVNGRISDASFRGYFSIKFLLKTVLNKINLFCVQTERDAKRLIRLGVVKDKIEMTGNMKFDITDYADFKKDYTDYKIKLGLESGGKLFVAGSTHPGEEEIILEVYKNLCNDYADLRLLIAPRHPERTPEITNLIKKFGFEAARISLLNRRTGEPKNLRTVFVLDTVGQLVNYYCLADLVFVGGSLVRKGGHNILEPASEEKPIFFGPYMFNFRDIADLFLENNACILVHNPDELEQSIRDLLNNPAGMAILGKRAKELILQNQGATKRNLRYVKKWL
jgi:3-deoxy-D-manno-octulosonic-acid transferase